MVTIVYCKDLLSIPFQPSAEDDAFGDVSGATNDEVGLVIKPDDTLPEINFIQGAFLNSDGANCKVELSGKSQYLIQNSNPFNFEH